MDEVWNVDEWKNNGVLKKFHADNGFNSESSLSKCSVCPNLTHGFNDYKQGGVARTVILGCGHVICDNCLQVALVKKKPDLRQHDAALIECSKCEPPQMVRHLVLPCVMDFKNLLPGDDSVPIDQRLTFLQKFVVCPRHSKPTTQMCITCSELTCDECLQEYDDHSRIHHKTGPLPHIDLNYITSWKIKLQNQTAAMFRIEKVLQAAMIDHTNNSNLVLNEISVHFYNILNALLGRFCQIYKEIRAEKKEATKVYSRELKKCFGIFGKLNNCRSLVDTLNNGIPGDVIKQLVFVGAKDIHESLSSQLENIQNIVYQISQGNELQFQIENANTKEVMEMISNWGNVYKSNVMPGPDGKFPLTSIPLKMYPYRSPWNFKCSVPYLNLEKNSFKFGEVTPRMPEPLKQMNKMVTLFETTDLIEYLDDLPNINFEKPSTSIPETPNSMLSPDIPRELQLVASSLSILRVPRWCNNAKSEKAPEDVKPAVEKLKIPLEMSTVSSVSVDVKKSSFSDLITNCQLVNPINERALRPNSMDSPDVDTSKQFQAPKTYLSDPTTPYNIWQHKNNQMKALWFSMHMVKVPSSVHPHVVPSPLDYSKIVEAVKKPDFVHRFATIFQQLEQSVVFFTSGVRYRKQLAILMASHEMNCPKVVTFTEWLEDVSQMATYTSGISMGNYPDDGLVFLYQDQRREILPPARPPLIFPPEAERAVMYYMDTDYKIIKSRCYGESKGIHKPAIHEIITRSLAGEQVKKEEPALNAVVEKLLKMYGISSDEPEAVRAIVHILQNVKAHSTPNYTSTTTPAAKPVVNVDAKKQNNVTRYQIGGGQAMTPQVDPSKTVPVRRGHPDETIVEHLNHPLAHKTRNFTMTSSNGVNFGPSSSTTIPKVNIVRNGSNPNDRSSTLRMLIQNKMSHLPPMNPSPSNSNLTEPKNEPTNDVPNSSTDSGIPKIRIKKSVINKAPEPQPQQLLKRPNSERDKNSPSKRKRLSRHQMNADVSPNLVAAARSFGVVNTELDEDGKCKYCWVCNDELDKRGEKGICARCPRVYHGECHLPRITCSWDDLPDHWTCAMCEPTKTSCAYDLMDMNIQKLCIKVLLSCYQNVKNVVWFRQPVVDEEYFEYIENPMDLGTIAKNLCTRNHEESIESSSDFIFHMNLVFQNCATYNRMDTPVYAAGVEVWKLYQEAVKRYLPQHIRDVWLYLSLYNQKEKISKKKAAAMVERHATYNRFLPQPVVTSSTRTYTTTSLQQHQHQLNAFSMVGKPAILRPPPSQMCSQMGTAIESVKQEEPIQ